MKTVRNRSAIHDLRFKIKYLWIEELKILRRKKLVENSEKQVSGRSIIIMHHLKIKIYLVVEDVVFEY